MSASHGGIDPWAAAKAGVNPADILDFSISINPAPLPPSIRKVIGDSALYRYPDGRSRVLVEALSKRNQTMEDEILVVNGTSQAIFLIAAALLRSGDKVVVAGPAYGEYRDACEVYGARVLEYRAREEDDFRPDCVDLVRMVRKESPKILWVCNPNSPTGAWIDESEQNLLAAECQAVGCVLVLDEAYAKFAPPGLLPEGFCPGAIHLHSMTKDFCIPGLRLGWLRAEASMITALERLQPDWSVSAPAQDAGSACLEQLDYFEDSWAETRRLTGHLASGLEGMGLKPIPSAANFLLVRIGNDDVVKALTETLWKDLIMVRDCASFGLEGCLRIGTRSREDIDRLISIMKEAL